ncbi:MAG: nuclear transport factor 2 family protein [Candidatus Acidiferrales bacterium]
MSNTTIVQDLYAAFSRGDIATVMAGLADDVVWESEGTAVLKASGIRHGKTETMGFFAALAEDSTDTKLTVTEYVASGDVVMTMGRFAGTAKVTGKKYDTAMAHYWKFRDGKVVRFVTFSNTAALVEALTPLSAGAAG